MIINSIKKRASKNKNNDEFVLIGDQLNFASHEAYRLLRTNLTFSFAGEKKCRIIGMISSVKGEGKTTTSINLAYTLAENNAKVCLVEGDMRMPQIAKRLELDTKNGLSELLTGQVELKLSIKEKKFEKCSISCISSGRVPPNPAELLASDRMKELLDDLSKDYDYIIVDLPPVDVVSDALVIGNLLDGVVMVVGQGIAQKKLVKLAMRQLSMTNIKVLGFVRTFTTMEGFGYKKKYRSKDKYSNYGYGDYSDAAKRAQSRSSSSASNQNKQKK